MSTAAPFDSPFFQRQSPGGTVEILDHRGQPRLYTFPTLFTQSVVTMVVLTGSLSVARELLRGAPVQPVAVWPDRCLVTLAFFRYGQLSDGMVGYHEAAVGIGVDTSGVPLVPAALRGVWPSFGVWVTHLPVDSAENNRRGQAIWNLPKVVRRFEDSVTDGARVGVPAPPGSVPRHLAPQAGQGIRRGTEPGGVVPPPLSSDALTRVVAISGDEGLGLRVRVPIAGRARHIEEENRVYSVRDGVLLRTRTRVSGNFQVWSAATAAKGFSVEVGDDPWFAPVRDLALGDKPLLVRHCDAMDSALYLGEPVG